MSELSTVARGRKAEALALQFLIDHHYQPIACNHRCSGGEIDIIALDGSVLCFVEVRARASVDHGDPLETIDRLKIRRIVLAAQDYLDKVWQGPWPMMRFDAVGIVLQDPPILTLVKEAFEV